MGVFFKNIVGTELKFTWGHNILLTDYSCYYTYHLIFVSLMSIAAFGLLHANISLDKINIIIIYNYKLEEGTMVECLGVRWGRESLFPFICEGKLCRICTINLKFTLTCMLLMVTVITVTPHVLLLSIKLSFICEGQPCGIPTVALANMIFLSVCNGNKCSLWGMNMTTLPKLVEYSVYPLYAC